MKEQKISALQMCITKTARELEGAVDMLEIATEIKSESEYSLVDGTKYRVTVKVEEVTE